MSRKLVGAILLVSLIGAACGDSGGSADTTTSTVASSPTTTAESSTVPTTTSSTTTAPTSSSSSTPTTVPATTTAPSTQPESEDVAEAAAAFEAWVGAIADGDTDKAWELLAPTSQRAVGREEFNRLMVVMSEGWAAWSRADDVSYRLGEDEAGRRLLWVSGTVTREGMTETTENSIPIVESDSGILVSPFEEFGNVAEGIRQEVEGVEAPPVPEASGEGRRIVYSNPDQRVWLVDDDGAVMDSYLVSGKQGVPAPGTYEVYSRSETAYAGHDDITMRYMVRFAHGDDLPIGFHAIPNTGAGAPLQSEEELGEYRSAGCVRQSLEKAAFLFEWAVDGTPVVVLA